jgi:hypothetical protein
MSCFNKIKSVDPDNWRPFGQKVTGCLIEPFEGQCKLRFSQQLAAIVIVFNAVKALVLVCVFFCIKENPLVTIGDAVVSFVAHPDEATKGWCLMSKKSSQDWVQHRSIAKAIQFKTKRKSWSIVISFARWVVCIVAYVLPNQSSQHVCDSNRLCLALSPPSRFAQCF